jgi:multidrug resistance efflux pump
MKLKISSIPALLFAANLLFASCNTPEEKVDNAQENVSEAQEDLEQAKIDYIAEIEDYRLKSIAKAEENDKAMIEFKARIKDQKIEARADYNKKLAELEKKNSDLKKKMADYKEDGKDNWETFKAEFNHDMDELGAAFNDLTVKNTNK